MARENRTSRKTCVIWLCDCSGSMSVDGKIEALNFAIRDSISVIDEAGVDLSTQVIKFSDNAQWHVEDPIGIQELKSNWHSQYALEADPLIVKNSPKLDVIFLLDTSSSMKEEIVAVKEKCSEFADRVMKRGIDIRLGLAGFAIGKHTNVPKGVELVTANNSRFEYTIGIWPLLEPVDFQREIQSLEVGIFGNRGCFIANKDTVPVFKHVVGMYGSESNRNRILVVISDELGGTEGLAEINNLLRDNGIVAHVLGVVDRNKNGGGAHERIAQFTGGQFWNIRQNIGVQDFEAVAILQDVAERIIAEIDNGTNVAEAIALITKKFDNLPNEFFDIPPTIVLISDGNASKKITKELENLKSTYWGKKSKYVAIAIGKDADEAMLEEFTSQEGGAAAVFKANAPEKIAVCVQNVYMLFIQESYGNSHYAW